MVNSLSMINKINGGVSQSPQINSQGANPFVKEAITDLWNFIDTSLTEANFNWHDNIQNQISNIENQTQNYKEALANPFGNSLNISG